MFFKCKIIILISLLAVISAKKQDISSEKDNSVEKDILKDDSENKNPSKRGVYYQGNGFIPESYSSYYGYQIPNFASSILNKPSLLSSNRPVAFSAPAGFGSSIHYANAPSIFGNGIAPLHTAPVHFGVPANHVAAIAPIAPTQYTIRPGGAVVQSYNINYPQLQYHHKHYPTYAVAAAPVPAAIAPPPPAIPVNSLHYHPTFAASPAHIGFSFPSAPVAASIPQPPVSPGHIGFSFPAAPIAAAAAIPQPPIAPIVPQHFFINRPPAIGIQYAPAPAPIPIIPQRPSFVAFGTPSPALGTFPSVIPIASGSAPGHIPAATPITPTIPTTLATPWRPIVINNPGTTSIPQPAGSSANRPPISLLPPYGAAERPNDEFSHYYQAQSQNQQNQQELAEQNYYAEQSNKGYHY